MRKGMMKKVVALLLVVMTCLSIVPMTASAATTMPYYKTYGETYKTNSDDPTFAGPPENYDIYMYGSSTSGSGTLYSGAYINWDEINIWLDVKKDVDFGTWFRLQQYGEDLIFDSSPNDNGEDTLLFSGTLSDGPYKITYLSHHEENFLFVYWSSDYHYSFEFTVDRTPPTITGASTSTKYTNTGFTVSASDATSGVKTFWYAEPGDEYYKAASSNSVTIPAGSAEGYYHFYATDNAGNKSAYHYVYYDETAPTGKITNTSGTTLTGAYTNKAFKYVASDGESGIGRRRVWKPGASAWEDYSGSTIYTSSPDGTYYFYCADRAGNQSSQKYITLDSTAPTGTLYGGTTVVANGGSIVADYARFVPSDATSGVKNTYVKTPGASSYASYTSGSKFYTKGTYYFYCTDNAGNTSSTYSMTLLDPTPTPDPVETYIVDYHANGGSGAPAYQVKVKDVNLTLSSVAPCRSGYTFMGWGTSSSTSTVSYIPGGTYLRNASITLYAIWSKDAEEYTVSYNANGGSGAPASQTKYEDVNLTLRSGIPTRSGYTFRGWSESSSASSPSYSAGGTYTRNASTTMYAVWEKDTEQYTVTYNATGGTGAPATQIKIEDIDLTLSSTKPTRSGYDFMGWSTSSSDTSVDYDPGDIYSVNASMTLYAVWQEVNYDFSVSDLEVTPSEVRQFETVNVSLRVDSWDRYNPYSDIPIEVLLNGVTVYSTTVDISAYGIKYINFNLNVGALQGTQTLEARVNWDDHYRETRTTNNSVSTTFNVKKIIESATDDVSITGDYVAGHDVISSFYVYNEGTSGIIPSDGVSFDFEVYKLDASGNKTVVSRQSKNNIVIPANGTNLVYFKWTVPEGSAGTRYYCKGTISPSDGEQNTANNTAEYSVVSSSLTSSETPNTRYESNAPAGYNSSATTPTTKTGSATWNEWIYENGDFVLKKYGIAVSNTDPTVKPSAGCTTAVKNGTLWTMKSGYGITLEWNSTIRAASGCTMPSANAYTGIQSAYALFPEYAYSTVNGKYRTLEKTSSGYVFPENTHTDGNERLHFIPVYVDDGNYTVSATVSHIWTPAGMITSTKNANTIRIDGTIYDDWYQG